jgi:hypothetical protein
MSSGFVKEHRRFDLVFVSLTPLVSYRDPHEIRTFIEELTSFITGSGQLGIYGLDSDMHDETETNLLEGAMSGIIDIKENDNARSKDHKNLLMIRTMPHCSPTRWLPFMTDERSYKIG